MYKSIKTTRDGCSLASLLKLTGFARSGYIQVSTMTELAQLLGEEGLLVTVDLRKLNIILQVPWTDLVCFCFDLNGV